VASQPARRFRPEDAAPGRVWHLKLMTLCVRREAIRLLAAPVADYFPKWLRL